MDSERGSEPAEEDPAARLPVMPGFRELAARRMADERAARMAEMMAMPVSA